MTARRVLYLQVAEAAAQLVGAPAVGASWESASALAQWSVAGLTGHLVRAVTTVEQYLDATPPDPALLPATPGDYYVRVLDTFDLDAELHQTIRKRGENMAAGGHEALLDQLEGARRRLETRLFSEPGDRRLAALGGLVLTLDDYLATRVVELVVHVDDLATSVGMPPPEIPVDALELTTEVLIQIATIRHGHLAVVRALSRRERDGSEALRIF